MDTETKTCPLCAETIKATAKVCPHCRSWQKKWSLQNPQVVAMLWGSLWMAVFLSMFAVVEKVFGPKNQFAEYRDEISVISSQFSHRVSGSESNSYVVVVGTLTNRSGIGWKNVGVEARFVDKSGNLLDTITVDADYSRGVVLLPHGEAAFKIEGKAARPKTDYENCEVAVRWAKDIAAWP